MQLVRLGHRSLGLPQCGEFQSNVNIFAQEIVDFRAMGFFKQFGTQVGCPDGVGLIHDKGPSDIKT